MSDNVPAVNVKVIEVSELKQTLSIDGTRSDQELEQFCIIASLAIEDMTGGTAFIRRTFTEDHAAGHNGFRGGAKRLRLNRGPIYSVTSITDDDSNTVASTEYTVVNVGNADSYLEHDTYWPSPVGRWTVVYVAGVFEDTDDVDWDVKHAARLEAARTYGNRKGEPVLATSLSGRAGSRSVSKSQTSYHDTTMQIQSRLSRYMRRGV